MMLFFKKTFNILFILLVLFVSLSIVSAQENTTQFIADGESFSESLDEISVNNTIHCRWRKFF